MPTLSVVLPNYNHGQFIADALTAIVNQSFKPKEVIVVDDASTDNSVQVIQSFISKYPFVRLIRNEKNQGVVASTNRGTKEATGDYITYLAADDRVLPGHFEKSMRLLENYPEAGLCSSMAEIWAPDGASLGVFDTPMIRSKPSYVSPKEAMAAFKKHGNWIVTQSAVFKRSAVLEMGGYRPEFRHSADGFLIYSITMKYGACFIPEVLAAWRKMPTGVAAAFGKDFAGMRALIDRIAEALTATDGFPREMISLWKRRGILGYMYEASCAVPFPAGQILELARSIPAPSVWDKLFVKTLEAAPNLAPRTTKIYIFSQHPSSQQRRIVARKMRGWLGFA